MPFYISFNAPLCLKIGSIFCLIMLLHGQALAQETEPTPPEEFLEEQEPESSDVLEIEYELNFDIGVTSIENSEGNKERFLATAFKPEFFYGPYSGGLFLRSHLHTKDRNFRSEDYDSFGDFLSIIRYFQYSDKDQPGYYVRFGEFEDATMGFGQFINFFQNSISLDNQKRGIEFQYKQDRYTAEVFYSNLLAAEVFGLRGSYYPFVNSPFSKYKKMAFGASLSGDLSDKGTLTNEELPGAPFLVAELTDSLGIRTAVGNDDGRILMVGADVSMPIFETPISYVLTYAELSKILNHGMGIGIGFKGNWQPDEEWDIEMQLEQRYLGKEYIPNYFSSVYEAIRLQDVSIPVEDSDEDVPALNTLRNFLIAEDAGRLGSYLDMTLNWNRTVRLIMSYENAWNNKDNSWLHVDFRLRSEDLPVFIRLQFDVLENDTLEDLQISGDKLNFFRLETAVRVIDFLMLGFGIRTSFEPSFSEGIPTGLKRQRRIEPKFILTL